METSKLTIAQIKEKLQELGVTKFPKSWKKEDYVNELNKLNQSNLDENTGDDQDINSENSAALFDNVIEESELNEFSDIEYNFFDELYNDIPEVKETILDNFINEKRKEILDYQKPEKIKVELQQTIQPSAYYNETESISFINMVVNNRSIPTDDNYQAIDWLKLAYQHIEKTDKSRIIRDIPSNWINIKSIEIQMSQKYIRYYGVAKTNKDVKSNQVTDLTNVCFWHKELQTTNSQKEQLNRNHTNFEIGIISPPSEIENSQVMNKKIGREIYFNLYDEKWFVTDKKKDKYDETKFQKYDKPMPIFEIEHIKINGSFYIGKIGKLERANVSDKTKAITINKLRTGILPDMWSMPFTVVLKKHDYLSDKFGIDREVRLFVKLENNAKLNLYYCAESYSSKQNNNQNGTFRISKSNIETWQKVIELSDIEVSELATYQWFATSPQWEQLAIQMKKGKLLPSTEEKFNDIVYKYDELWIGNRLVCKRRFIGNSLHIIARLNNKFLDKDGQIESKYHWLEVLRQQIVKKMLQSNAKYINNNVDMLRQEKSITDRKIQKMKKNILSNYRRLLRIIEPNATQENQDRIAILSLKYLVEIKHFTSQQMTDHFYYLKNKNDVTNNLIRKFFKEVIMHSS
jgi:hypothetical protein